MIKARHALLLLPLALAACSSSDDDDELSGTDSPDPELPDDTVERTYQVIFTNLSTAQPMTPPVVAVHDTEISVFEPGEPVSEAVRAIAEDGEFGALRDSLTRLVGDGVGSRSVAFVQGTPTVDGLLPPGGTAIATLTSDSDAQVLSFVSMIVCSNDGFTGLDSLALSAGVQTVIAENYDAGSEQNTASADYWVEPCGTEGNLHVDEGGVITVHPGQQPVGGDADRAFESGAELMQVQITRN